MKKTFWTIAAFYFLIAFEFFYMASPFALYFYSIYGPGLNLFINFPLFGRLTSFFLPHIVIETKSPLINSHNYVGGILFLVGMIGFFVTAAQIYINKIKKYGMVSGGIYKFVRHPQYSFLIIGGFGLLLLWPRFFVIIPYIAIIFAYYSLARSEEIWCLKKFGQAYQNYKETTGMFLPFKVWDYHEPNFLNSKLRRFLFIIISYCLLVTVSFILASLIRTHSVKSLYTYSNYDTVYISVGAIEDKIMREIDVILSNDQSINDLIMENLEMENLKLISYILPPEWYVSEIGMNKLAQGHGHHFPSTENHNQYKIVITKATLQAEYNWKGIDILLNTVKRETVLEAFVDLSRKRVYKILPPPSVVPYQGIPRPIF